MSRARTKLKRIDMPTAMAAVVILSFFAVGCDKTKPEPITSNPAPSQGEPKPKWDYSTERGPEQWGELSPDYVLAAIGRSQSPIDIVTKPF